MALLSVAFLSNSRRTVLTPARLSDMNLPFAGLAAAVVYFYLKMRIPEGNWWTKTKRIDWM